MKLTTFVYLLTALTSVNVVLGLPTEASTPIAIDKRAPSFRADYSGKVAFKDDKGKTLGYFRGYCLSGLVDIITEKTDATTVYFNKTSSADGVFQLFVNSVSPLECIQNSTALVGLWATPVIGPDGQQGEYLKDLSANDPPVVNMKIDLYKRTYYNSVNDTKIRSDARAKIWTYNAKTKVLAMQWTNAKTGQVFKPRPVNVFYKYFVPPIPYNPATPPGIYSYTFTSWASDATKFAADQSKYRLNDLERRVVIGTAYLEA